MAIVKVERSYEASAERLWALATDYDALAEVSGRYVSFRGLPSGRVRAGQVLEVEVSLFGRLPWQPYRMEVLECDDAAMRFRSNEQGAGVEVWRHEMTVIPEGPGCRLRDVIEIEAGWKTPLVTAWARHLYRSRHEPRLRLLEAGVF